MKMILNWWALPIAVAALGNGQFFEPACSRVGEWIRSLLLPVSAKGRLLAIPVHLPNV